MKLPPFDLGQARWDRFHAFHIAHGPGYEHYRPIIQFDTGELIIDQCRFKPGERGANEKIRDDLHIAVVATRDYDLPKLQTPEGETIVPAWLRRGRMQTLCIDYDTRRVVAFNRVKWHYGPSPNSTNLLPDPVPERFRHVRVYFPGPGCPPVGGAIRVQRPLILNKEQRAHLRALRLACRAWLSMQDALVNIFPVLPPLKVSEALGLSFGNLTDSQRYCTGKCGFATEYPQEYHPYLLLAE